MRGKRKRTRGGCKAERVYIIGLVLFSLQVILGKVVSRESTLDQDIAKAILSCQNDNSFKTVLGGTMCTDDFYEGTCMCKYLSTR